MPVIDGTDLASYPGITLLATDLEGIAAQASDLVTDAWATPVDPVPAWVKNIAMAAAARALWNPKGLEQLSRQLDDSKRTEIYAKDGVGRVGLYLTDREAADLGAVSRTAGIGSIRVSPRGWCG